MKNFLYITIFFLCSSLFLSAQTDSVTTKKSADEIARELANPNNSFGSLSFLFDYIHYGGDLQGASNENAYRMSFQPSLPYPISKSLNIFFRPLIPIVFRQPVPNSNGGFDCKGVALADISYDLSVGKTLPGGIILLGGIVGSIPTATDDALGLHQWLLGPEALFAVVGKWGAVGLLVTQSWNIAGSNKSSTSITGGQYFYTINLGNAWQITGSPTWSYNHKASSGNQFTFPIGTGVNKTLILGSTPLKISIQYWYYIASPDTFGPKDEVRLSITPVIPLPW